MHKIFENKKQNDVSIKVYPINATVTEIDVEFVEAVLVEVIDEVLVIDVGDAVVK
jgi:hypothetical protein